MRKSHALKSIHYFVFATILVFTTSLRATVNASDVNHPNIIVIHVDDQGWAGTNVSMDESVEGSSNSFFVSPQLERLAERGLRFSQGYSSAPKCAPARAGIFTGQTPARLRFTENSYGKTQVEFSKEINGTVICPYGNDQLPPEAQTIAEWLHENAPQYVSGHFGKWHIGRAGNGPAEQGFDYNDGPNGNAEGNIRETNAQNFEPDDPKWVFTLAEKSNNFMREQVKNNNPFYLHISHYAVHLGAYTKPSTLEKVKAQDNNPPGLEHEYIGMAHDLDASLGRVLDEVKKLGIEDNTYIFYISDNGGERPAANGPLAKGKRWNWEGGIRVPFIVAGPGIPQGQATKVPAAGFDIFPTVCDLIGKGDKTPDNLDGGSLKEVLLNPATGTINRHYDGLFFHVGRYFRKYFVTPHSALILGDYKFILEYDSRNKTGSHRWLYNLNEDIGEKNNLVSTMPAKADEMQKILMAYLQKVGAEIPEPNPNYTGPNPYVPLDAMKLKN
jgi:arylsulfatase A-like enzyme